MAVQCTPLWSQSNCTRVSKGEDRRVIYACCIMKIVVVRAVIHTHLPYHLDRADELHGKHTVFGRVIGDTLYSASLVLTATIL